MVQWPQLPAHGYVWEAVEFFFFSQISGTVFWQDIVLSVSEFQLPRPQIVVANPISRVGSAAQLGRGVRSPRVARRTHTQAFFFPRRPSRVPEHL